MSGNSLPSPSPLITEVDAPRLPRRRAGIDLCLDANEGPAVSPLLVAAWQRLDPEAMRRYPTTHALEAAIATKFAVTADRVLVTAGADEALDRFCRAVLAPGRDIVLPEPTFEMLPRYVRLSGATAVSVPWLSGTYPIDAVLSASNERTVAVAFVSPNNPTGLAGTRQELERLLIACPDRWVLVDLAYAEFAADDVTDLALRHENAVIVRTLSKAWGLAGLRIGWVMGSPRVIDWLRRAGSPYTVSGPAVALGLARLGQSNREFEEYVATIRCERRELFTLLQMLGAVPWPTQGNFILARFKDATFVEDAMAGLGIAVRRIVGKPGLEETIRITCPGDDRAFARLRAALGAALSPRCVVLSLDPRDRGTWPSGDVLARLGRRVRVCVASRMRADDLHAAVAEAGLAVLPEDQIAMYGPSAAAEVRTRLGLDRGWWLSGDAADFPTARAAGFVPFGSVATGDVARHAALVEGGAARTLTGPEDLVDSLGPTPAS